MDDILCSTPYVKTFLFFPQLTNHTDENTQKKRQHNKRDVTRETDMLHAHWVTEPCEQNIIIISFFFFHKDGNMSWNKRRSSHELNEIQMPIHSRQKAHFNRVEVQERDWQRSTLQKGIKWSTGFTSDTVLKCRKCIKPSLNSHLPAFQQHGPIWNFNENISFFLFGSL